MPDSSREYLPHISAALDDLTRAVGERVTLGELVDRLGGHAFELLILVLALPNAAGLGTVPGLSTVFGVPQMLIALQRALGHEHPWLPRRLRTRPFARADLERVIGKIQVYLHKIERMVRPRWPVLTSLLAERLIAAVMAFLALLISLPLPLANQPPAVAIAVLAIGLAARDGLVVAIGLCLSVLSIALVAGVLAAGAGALIALLRGLFG